MGEYRIMSQGKYIIFLQCCKELFWKKEWFCLFSGECSHTPRPGCFFDMVNAYGHSHNMTRQRHIAIGGNHE